MDTMLTYRRGLVTDLPGIADLLDKSGLHWPAAGATPYVAVEEAEADSGGGEKVWGVYFKCVMLHAEPLLIKHGHGVSVSALADVMRRDIEQLATEIGQPIVVFSVVQNNEHALAAAKKNGMTPVEGVLHAITISPKQQTD